MKEFPNKLQVDNKFQFSSIHYERTKQYLRRELYEHIISHEEKDYYDLHKFNHCHLNNVEILEKMVKELCSELENLGWTTKTSYGGTGLFIYSDVRPPNCFPDGF